MKCTKFTCGLLVGAAIGLLLAPNSGKDTRKKLCDLKDDVKDKFDDMFCDGKKDLEKLKNMLEDEAEEITASSRKKLIALIENNLGSVKDELEA